MHMKRKRMNRFPAILALVICLAVSFWVTGCSSGSSSSAGDSGSSGTTQATTGEYDDSYSSAAAPEEFALDSATDAGSGVAAPGEDNASQEVADPNRKLIKTQTVVMETTEFDSLNDWIQEQVKAAQGYIENAYVSGNSAGVSAARTASYVLRIPVSGVDGFMEKLRGEGNVLQYSENVVDVTLDYTDTESHIAALEEERDTLMNMLSQADDLDTLLTIQNRLTEVRYQLENYESQLRIYDNDIEYSTVNLEISEVERETVTEDTSFLGRLSEQLFANFYALGKGLQGLALWFLGALPAWIVLAVLGIAAYSIYKGVRRRKRRAALKAAEEAAEKERQNKQKEEKQEKNIN